MGWITEISQFLTDKALSDGFDGKVLNPCDVEIDLPFWVFKRLKKLHLLERDPATGRRRIQTHVFGLMDLWDGPDFRPDRCFRAFDAGIQRSGDVVFGPLDTEALAWVNLHFRDEN